MNIEQIMIEVQEEFQSSGLTDGLYGDFTREVAKRAAAAERERCAAWLRWYDGKETRRSEAISAGQHWDQVLPNAKVRGAHDDLEQ